MDENMVNVRVQECKAHAVSVIGHVAVVPICVDTNSFYMGSWSVLAH